MEGVCKIGIRIATEEEPNFEFLHLAAGHSPFRSRQIFSGAHCLQSEVSGSRCCIFFVDTGIKDSLYYWGELRKAIKIYCEIKRESKDLSGINIGGGMPIRNSLSFEFDYKYMVKEIVANILNSCEEEEVSGTGYLYRIRQIYGRRKRRDDLFRVGAKAAK